MRYRNGRFGFGGGYGSPGYNYPGAGYGYNAGQGYPGSGFGYPGYGFGGGGYPGYGYGPGYGPGFGGYGFNPLTTGLLGFGAGLLGGAVLNNNDGPFRGYYYY
ncbi:hypothetical protein [Metabacillus halosaccharovorans]|uniref:hypothetical protein n=1 Tax=Metabacillus halosaccharovorans TaxID=930124 RepID=UPI000994E7BB|nr:hypothetical protein [Metabacillus halosaccharovorans]